MLLVFGVLDCQSVVSAILSATFPDFVDVQEGVVGCACFHTGDGLDPVGRGVVDVYWGGHCGGV